MSMQVKQTATEGGALEAQSVRTLDTTMKVS